MNIVYYLVLILRVSTSVVPEPFIDKQACQEAGKAWKTETSPPGRVEVSGFVCLPVNARGE